MHHWFFDPTNEATSVLFLTGHMQEPFTMEGTWAALSRLSPSPIGLKSCGLCQDIFVLSRAEKLVTFFCLARWRECKIPPFSKHTHSPTWKYHKDPNVLMKVVFIVKKEGVCFYGKEECEHQQGKHIPVPLYHLPKLAIYCPSSINWYPIVINSNNLTSVILHGPPGPLLWLSSMHQNRQVRKGLLSHGASSSDPGGYSLRCVFLMPWLAWLWITPATGLQHLSMGVDNIFSSWFQHLKSFLMYLIIPENVCTSSLLTAPSQTLLLVHIREMWDTLHFCSLVILLLNCVTLDSIVMWALYLHCSVAAELWTLFIFLSLFRFCAIDMPIWEKRSTRRKSAD